LDFGVLAILETPTLAHPTTGGSRATYGPGKEFKRPTNFGSKPG